MKKIILNISILLILSVSSYSQDWLVDGNNNTQLGGSLTPSLGTNGNRPLLFETNGLERMRLTPLGLLGLNTTTPLGLYHQHNGYLFATSDVGFNSEVIDVPPTTFPISGQGIRMMWVDSLGAFRADNLNVLPLIQT